MSKKYLACNQLLAIMRSVQRAGEYTKKNKDTVGSAEWVQGIQAMTTNGVEVNSTAISPSYWSIL